jgi:hypothetical protein
MAELIRDDIMAHTPDAEYNLCGIDCLELPGECLCVTKNFDTWEEAVRPVSRKLRDPPTGDEKKKSNQNYLLCANTFLVDR